MSPANASKSSTICNQDQLLRRLQVALKQSSVPKNQVQWYLTWVKRFAEFRRRWSPRFYETLPRFPVLARRCWLNISTRVRQPVATCNWPNVPSCNNRPA